MVSDAEVKTPLAALSSVTDTVSEVEGSISPRVTPVNGVIVVMSVTVCPAAAPLIVGALLMLVLTTVVVVFVTAKAMASLTATVKVVVSVLPVAWEVWSARRRH